MDNEVFQISVQKLLMHYAKFCNKTPPKNQTVALRMRKLVRMSRIHQGLPLTGNCLNTSFTVHSEVSFMWLWTEMVPHQGRIKLQLLKWRKALWSEKTKINLFGQNDEERRCNFWYRCNLWCNVNSNMLWGSFSASVTGTLHKVNGRQNNEDEEGGH